MLNKRLKHTGNFNTQVDGLLINMYTNFNDTCNETYFIYYVILLLIASMFYHFNYRLSANVYINTRMKPKSYFPLRFLCVFSLILLKKSYFQVFPGLFSIE